MEDDYLSAADCIFPEDAEVGDEWYCPGCARKWYYTAMMIDDELEAEAWFTTEIG